MPLVRVEVRNEYALGAPELYRDVNKEDPKEILEGVAVAGLVGVLRQLGDLAEFAAEVFHGLQEEVTITSSRSHKLMARVQRIEAALSPLEKAVLAQRSHLHFAYTPGMVTILALTFFNSDPFALPSFQCEENHFVYSDVPQFILDSYEDCRGPPRLHLLDRFDPSGPGSCLKRYSDPTFFKRASVASGEASTEKILHKKSRKIKKRRSWPKSRGVSGDASFSYHSSRMHFPEVNVGGHTSPSQSMSTYDATQRSDFGTQSNLDLRNGSDYIEGDFRPSYSVQTEEQESRESISSAAKRHDSDFLDYTFLEEKITDRYDDIQTNLSQEQAGCSSSSVTWDEKTETLEPTTQYDHDGMTEEEDHEENLDSVSPNLDFKPLVDSVVSFETVDKMDVQPFNQAVQTLESGDVHHDDIESETDQFMDALNTIESDVETDIDCIRKQEVEHYSKLEDKGVDDGQDLISRNLECQSSNSKCNVLTNSSPINDNCGHNLISVSPKSPYACDSSTNGVAAKDESNPVSLVENALQPTRRPEESSNLTSQSSSSHGNIHDTSVESSSPINDNCDHNLISVSPKSPYACDSSINGVAVKDESNSVSLVEKALQPTRRPEESSNLTSQSSSSHGNGTIHDTSVESSSSINDNCGHILISVSPKSSYACDSSNNGVAAKDESNSVSLLEKALQPTRRLEEPSNLTSQSSNSHGNGNIHDTSVESVSSAVSCNFRDDSSVMPIIDGKRRSSEPQKHVPETSNITPVTFWTNGGLLGLQPSKPPDFTVLNGLPQDPASKKVENISSSSQHLIISDKNPGKPDQRENFKNIEEGLGTSFRKTSWKISPADLDITIGKLGDSFCSNNASSTKDSAKNPQKNSGTSSRIFELSNKLLTTGSNNKILHGGVENSRHSGYQNVNALERKNSQNVAYRTFSGRTRGPFGGESPKLSPSSSPPLEHMKISFQPVDSFETSKLKLKFPDGNTNNESSRDIFPSFQLVPEESIAGDNVGSDSDDDTFYRSSPSLSNDGQSESNSEQWESGGESPTSKDHDLYDSLQRISLTESVSNGRTTNGDLHDIHGLQFPSVENSRQNSQSCRSFDLKSLDTLNHSFREEIRNYTDSKDYVGPQFAPSPAPPPLPPMQWRGINPYPDTEKNFGAVSKYAFDITLSPSTISQQPKPAPLNHAISETINLQKTKQLSSQKSNGRRETNQVKSVDEKMDFLHQIRAKSFNLRPTVTAKSNVLSVGSANVQVTAMLEKANAIRQVPSLSLSIYIYMLYIYVCVCVCAYKPIEKLLEVMMEKKMVIGVKLKLPPLMKVGVSVTGN
ncbi:hypothetical protein BUALT_Bualt18G0115400 [Buddleja alternifolia]|uniref:Protein SCAR n=1 Tax=Buddleja alternifolia TaxID=168488 RepID=A0AAV6WDX3_9LAMI|nr:hypothetical protein BUALT_Bualt18G0115400 [Buddleja alternifolia]